MMLKINQINRIFSISFNFYSYRSENPLIKLAQNLRKSEKQCLDLVDQISKHKQKRDYYLSYTKNPELFIENIILQQNQFLKVLI